MRSVNNSLMGSQGLAGFLNSSQSSQNNLIEYMNQEATKKTNPTSPAISSQTATASNVNSDKGVYDPKTGTWASSGNQTVALQNLKDRQEFNQKINDVLSKNGIKLSSKEKLTLTVDQDGQIKVSGINDEQKRLKIEHVLNSATKDVSTGLLMHIESIQVMNGKQNSKELDKWMVYDFIKQQAGQDFSDLKLVNGKIVGANEKLQKILDSKLQDFRDNAQYVQEVITKLKSILTSGADKIPDLQLSIDFQNGSLIDKDVNNGFGPAQLKTWFNDFISGKAKWDVKA